MDRAPREGGQRRGVHPVAGEVGGSAVGAERQGALPAAGVHGAPPAARAAPLQR